MSHDSISHESSDMRARVSGRGKWAVLFTVVIMSFMSTLDSSIVNVALPSMQRELAASAGEIQWVSSMYLIVCCVTVLAFGRLADRYGKVALFQLGVAVFTAGSLLCGLSQALVPLILARVVQAIGASAAMATNMGIVTEAFPVRERGRALGVVSTFVSLGLMCGPVLGGLLVAAFPWEAIFLINVPIGVASFALGLRTLPRSARTAEEARAAAERAAVGRTEDTGGAGKLALFANPVFTANLVTMFLCFFAVGSTQLILPFYLQDACGLPSDVSGVMLTAIPLAMAVVGPIAGAVSDRVGTTPPCLVGLVIYAAGIAAAALMPAGASLVRVYATMLFMSLGTGLFQSPNNSRVMGSVDVRDLGFAGSLATLVRYLGMAAGVAGGTALLYGRMGALAGFEVASYADAPEFFMAGFSFAFLVIAGLVAAGAALTAVTPIIKRAHRAR